MGGGRKGGRITWTHPVKSSFSARRAEWRINCSTIKPRSLSLGPLLGSTFWNWGRYIWWIGIPWGFKIQWCLVMLQVVYVTQTTGGDEDWNRKRVDSRPTPLSLSLSYLSIQPDRITAEILVIEGIPASKLIEKSRPRACQFATDPPEYLNVNLSWYRDKPLCTRHCFSSLQERIALSRNDVTLRFERFRFGRIGTRLEIHS